MNIKNLKLVRPHVKYEQSFRSGFDELQTDSDKIAWVYLGEKRHDSYFGMSFKEYVDSLLHRENDPPQDFVCDTVYWAVNRDEVLGRISIRHTLNDFLKSAGGHIGFIVRPSARAKGAAHEMLRQILLTDRAKSIGQLLLTCDEGNVASEKTITRAGGVLENIISTGPGQPLKKRFWIHLNDHVEIEIQYAKLNIDEIKVFYLSCGYGGPVKEDDQVILARAGENIIGAVRLVEENSSFLLRGMYIRNDWHRRGVGTRMLKCFKDLISKLHIHEAYLICGRHLEPFYEQIGFKSVDNRREVPEFLVERSLGYQKLYGEQSIMRAQS